MEDTVIALSRLTKRYGEFTAVSELDLNIRRGEIFGLLGPNGAGKTTTILMMLGLAEPTSGHASVCGIDATRNPIEVKRRVGYMPDDIGFYEDRTGLDNLMYTAMLNRVPEAEARRRAVELLDKVGLGAALGKKTGAYSRGMRQRLGLADVLIKRPEVVILDEPTLGIDPEGVRELLALIRELSRDEGLTVLLSSHHLHQVQQICDRVGLFVGGRLIASGDLAALSQLLDGSSSYAVELDVGGWSDALANALRGLDRVTAVDLQETDALRATDRSDGFVTVRVTGTDDIAAELAAAVVSSGASLLGLRPLRYGLDEIYHRYFEGGNTVGQLH
ncbi:ABC transporter ATP-binding protein [Cohnella sp. GbtcB17]|uniref:ABC transporter ATP-binding protein n=1 Tax=Cohnella sp. GbtcB17 TaxID=2824762 RepID=UPI001C2F49B9|nr:ABC transporter ATP-binding protein [Cohnella sp. GbtcB17]